MEILTPGPIGKGTRFRKAKMVFKKEAAEEMKATEFEPSSRYVVEAEFQGTHDTSTCHLNPNAIATDIEITIGKGFEYSV